MIPWLGKRDPFPPVESALRDPNGLLAAGADLSVDRLLDAYARGIFPWSGPGEPLLWWSPDPRMVLYVDEVHVSRSLRRTLRSGRFRVTMDRAFREVMLACAEPRRSRDGTWITPEFVTAYTRLAALGYAHSVEVWAGEPPSPGWRAGPSPVPEGSVALVGGLYGVAIGRMFFGESMFSRRTDASKVALVYLARQLERWGYPMIDCQMSTRHLASLGARELSRAEFLRQVAALVREPPHPSPWSVDPDVAPSYNEVETSGTSGT